MSTQSTGGSVGNVGISMGCALAMILSYEHNHGILWAILHGCCSWIYVIYAALAH